MAQAWQSEYYCGSVNKQTDHSSLVHNVKLWAAKYNTVLLPSIIMRPNLRIALLC